MKLDILYLQSKPLHAENTHVLKLPRKLSILECHWNKWWTFQIYLYLSAWGNFVLARSIGEYCTWNLVKNKKAEIKVTCSILFYCISLHIKRFIWNLYTEVYSFFVTQIFIFKLIKKLQNFSNLLKESIRKITSETIDVIN